MRLGLLILLGGCGRILGSDGIDNGDGSVGSGTGCYGAGFGHVCLPNVPTGSVAFTTGVVNTDSSSCDPVASITLNACVMTAGSFMIGGLRATGSRPLVMIADTTLTVSGVLDLSSHLGGVTGAGAASTRVTSLCDVGSLSTGGGGAGGSFGTRGGNGGDSGAGSYGGRAGAPQPAALRAGCSGGGVGGGAVYLIAGSQIVITSSGRVEASGAAGNGGAQPSGIGDGGGSGGLIALDAPVVHNDGAICANGGGGGQGASFGAGANGNEPMCLAAAPISNAGTMAGGPGGGGGAAGVAPGNGGGCVNDGCGGGGGSVGIVKLFGATSIAGSGGISPAPS
jgi:hypothetical protein